ncbi:hypothetical protein BD769DRAFT_1678568 [Suillus cothurnatus]|nr:hypothetical protein BD769DRAFT_1678568 [Suillus cothurnatus]
MSDIRSSSFSGFPMVDPTCSLQVDNFVYLELSVIHEPALVREVFNNLDFLSDILAWRGTSTHTHMVGSPVLYACFARIVQPFVRCHVRTLAHVMHVTRAVITGSCAMRMFTGKDTATNNINFVIAQGTLDTFQSFIQDTLFYRWTTTKPHYAFQGVLASFTVYRRNNLFITVSEAKVGGVISIIASSPTTADMTMMTPGSLTILYPFWTLKHIMLANHTLFGGDHGSHDIGCITHPDFESHDNTYWLGPACGRLCPTLWRNAADSDRQSLILEWDARYSLRTRLARSNTIWRLSDRCANIYCPYNPANNARTVLLPPDPMPSDLTSILVQEARIRSHHPRYAGTRVALLYATCATSPHLVSVPFVDGVATLRHISQLEVSHWVDRLANNRFIVFTSNYRKTYNVNPGTSSDVPEYSYTFFREDPEAFSPPNLLVRDLASIVDPACDIAGNVLVVKHPKGCKHDIIDLIADDIAIVDALIKRAMSCIDSEFWM